MDVEIDDEKWGKLWKKITTRSNIDLKKNSETTDIPTLLAKSIEHEILLFFCYEHVSYDLVPVVKLEAYETFSLVSCAKAFPYPDLNSVPADDGSLGALGRAHSSLRIK